MRLSHIARVSVPVSDQARARRFYTDILGFAVVRDTVFQTDARWIELAPPGSQTTIVLVNWLPWMPPGSLHGLVLETDDVTAVYAWLQTQRVSAAPVEDVPWGRVSNFHDPDGNGWVIQENPGLPPA